MAQRSYFIADSEGELHEYGLEPGERDGTIVITTPAGDHILIDAYEPEPERLNLVFLESGETYDVGARAAESQRAYHVELEAMRFDIEVLNARQKRQLAAGVGARAAGGPELVSPMAGKVVAVEAAAGDHVDQGQCVLIVEAMKMENDLKAHLSGTLIEVLVEPGQAVEIGDVLARIEADA